MKQQASREGVEIWKKKNESNPGVLVVVFIAVDSSIGYGCNIEYCRL